MKMFREDRTFLSSNFPDTQILIPKIKSIYTLTQYTHKVNMHLF